MIIAGRWHLRKTPVRGPEEREPWNEVEAARSRIELSGLI